MTLPTLVGSTSGSISGSAAVSLTRASASATTGDVVFAAISLVTASGAALRCTNATFTNLTTALAVGSRTMQVAARLVDVADPTSYTFDGNGISSNKTVGMVAVRGTGITTQAELSNLQIGTAGLRAVTGTSFTNVAPSITTTASDMLVLTASMEATTTDDTVAPTVSGATLVLWSDDALIETVLWAQKNQSIAGATGNVTVTYQNTQASNGMAIQIGVPPLVAAAGGWQVKPTKVWSGTAWVTKPTKVWNGAAWVTKPTKVWTG